MHRIHWPTATLALVLPFIGVHCHSRGGGDLADDAQAGQGGSGAVGEPSSGAGGVAVAGGGGGPHAGGAVAGGGAGYSGAAAAPGGGGELGGGAGAGGEAGQAGSTGCSPVSPACGTYCAAKAAAPTCAEFGVALDACHCECENVLRADPTCSVLFDEFVVCGGDASALFCTGFDTAHLPGCEASRSEFAQCLAEAQGGGGSCTPTDAPCVTLCSAMAEPECSGAAGVGECACDCQEAMSVACHDRVENLVECSGSLLAFACDANGAPSLQGLACAAEWNVLATDCL